MRFAGMDNRKGKFQGWVVRATVKEKVKAVSGPFQTQQGAADYCKHWLKLYPESKAFVAELLRGAH